MPKEFKNQRPHLGRCNHITGSPVAGAILYRLIFWKPTIQHDGRLWSAKSRERLMWETGLSEKQVKDGLSKLRRLGLIMTSQHLFGGKNVNHVLVTEVAESALQAAA